MESQPHQLLPVLYESPSPLVEAWGDWVDRTEYLRDDQTFGFGNSRAVTFTSLDDRKDGSFRPVYETEQDLAESRAAARNLVMLTGIRTGILDSLANYTLGSGFTFTCEPESEIDRQGRVLAQAAQAIIDKFIDENDFNGVIDREIHLRSREDGEALIAFDEDEIRGGRVLVEFLEPDQIVQPANPAQLEDWLGFGNPSCWKFGVHTPERKTWKPIGYHVVRDGRGADWDYYPANRVEHVKRNVTRSAKRGVTDFYEVVADLKRESKLRGNAVQGASLQAAIAWIMQGAPGTTQSQISASTSTDKISQYTRAAGSGGVPKTQSVNHYPPGTTLKIPAGQEYLPGPLGAERNAGFELIAQYALRAIGVRWNMPEYMISGDASNANYASALVAESPFVKAREADQQFYKRHFLSLIWKVLRIHCESGRFERYGLGPEQYDDLMDLIRVECECPTVASRDPKVAVDSDKVLVDGGIMSKQTWAARNNLDYEQEQKLGALEKPPEPSPFGQPGGSPFGQRQQQPQPEQEEQEPQQPGQMSQAQPAGLKENCGTGEGGFKSGNDCASGGGGDAAAPASLQHSGKNAAHRGERAQIYISDLEFDAPLSDEVTPLADNRQMPIIVRETKTGYRLIDGFGRASGMKNAGKETIHAIIVTSGDVAERTGAGDDPEWVRKMHKRYSPTSEMAESTIRAAVEAALESVGTTDEAKAILKQLEYP